MVVHLRCLLALLFAVASLCIGGEVAAKHKGLKALAAPTRLTLDGLPNEWDADWRRLTVNVKGNGAGDDIGCVAAITYDADHLYVAAR